MKTLLVLLLVTAADADAKSRKPSAVAPSLPALTREEEDKIEEVIRRFVRADTGRLGGAEARQAIQEFDTLKAEAIPALIRGLNRACKENQSCPVLMISRKLSRLLLSSDDLELLEYARDEIGADVGPTKYAGMLKDLRVKLMLRKNGLARAGVERKPAPSGLSRLSDAELSKAAGSERGDKLMSVVRELGKRDGKEARAGLALAAGSYEGDVQKAARSALDGSLGRLGAAALSPLLEDDSAEVRKSAVRVAAAKHDRLVTKLIGRVEDDDAGVRAEARAALKALSKGQDYGPSPDADTAERRDAAKQWRDWFDARR